MSISSVTSTNGTTAVQTPATANSATTATTQTPASTSTPTDTVTISDAAKAALHADRAFDSLLSQLGGQVNQFEHQVTWQLDRGKPVTLPPGVTPQVATTAGTSPATPAETLNTTIAGGFAGLQSKIEAQFRDLTPAQQTKLADVKSKLATELTRFQGFAARRGASDAQKVDQYSDLTGDVLAKINAFEHQVTWQTDHGKAVTAPNTLTAAPAATGLVAATTTEIAIDPTNADSATVSTATSTNTAATSTATDTTANATTPPSVADQIAAGFAALKADVTHRLGHLSDPLQAEFTTFQSKLATEQTRFASFIARRVAYRAANPKPAVTQDVAA